jgi:hypothetical protein
MDYGQTNGMMQIAEEELQVDPRYLIDEQMTVVENGLNLNHSSKIEFLEAEIRELEAEISKKEMNCAEKDEQLKFLLAGNSTELQEMTSEYEECRGALQMAEKKLNDMSMLLEEKSHALIEIEDDLFLQNENMRTLKDTMVRREADLELMRATNAGEKAQMSLKLESFEKERQMNADKHLEMQCTLQQEGR